MKKEFLMLFALCLFSTKAMAAGKNDSIDQCQFVVVYDFVTNTYNKNGDATKDSVQLGTVVGTHVAKCMEYNRVMMEDFKEFRNKDYQMGEWNARPYNLPILFIGEPEGEISSFDKIVPNRYFYTEPTPNFGWELTDDTLTVGGYLCKKAVGKYAGRTWTVWYSEEVPASYGPWKLCGLPGMILQAKDKDNIFSFSFAGLIQRTAPIIYLSTNGCTTLQRNKFISHRNKLFCNKKYVEKPSYYIPQGTYDQLHIAEMWAGGPEPAAEEKLSVVSFDMVIPKKANAYQPLELK